MTSAIAWLGMYDHPSEHAANDALWQAVSEQLRAAGWSDVPDRLARHLSADEAWSHPRLLLGQICIRPWRERYPHLRPLLNPVYPHTIEPGHHLALVVVAGDSRYRLLDDLEGARVAVNDLGSNTGYALLEQITGPLDRWAGAIVETGSHHASLLAISHGEADVASIDEITFRLLAQAEPDLIASFRTVAKTHSAVTPPFVAGAWLDVAQGDFLAAVLRSVLQHPS